MKQIIRDWLCRLMSRGSPEQVADRLLHVVKTQTERLPPADALRFLFELDVKLYLLQSAQAVAYGEGVHSKHRHTCYHDFFTQRITAEERVLDLGCGQGALARDIAERCGCEVTAIDLSETNIALARERHAHPRVTYVQGDVRHGLPARRYDVIVLSNVLEHLERRVEFLRQVQQTAGPKRWLIRVPLFERDWRVPLKKELECEWRLDATHYTEYTQESFAEEVRQAGLSMIHMETRWGEIWCELR